MEKLKDLYHKRQVFAEFNSPIPPELLKQIRDAEIENVTSICETVTGYLPEEIDMPPDCSVIIGLEYRDGKLVKIASSLNSHLGEKFDYFSDVNNEEPEEDNDDTEDNDAPEDANNRRRSKSIGFSVIFADGKVIKFPNAQRTMIEALRYMGLERSSKYRDEMFKGFPLIGKEQRTTDGKRWQRKVDGWWVYINMTNERKITCLKGVAKMLNIDLEIVPNEEQEAVTAVKKNKRRTYYSLNGSNPMAKNRSVLATVKHYLDSEAPYFKEIQAAFPASLQGSYGVVRTLEDIKQRSVRNNTEQLRWFLNDDEVLESVDGVAFAVSNEWGDNFEAFREHVNNILKYSLVEV